VNLPRRGKLAANFCGKCAVNLPRKRKKFLLRVCRGKFAANFAAQKKKFCAAKFRGKQPIPL
jgi:hypothetical protein